MSYTIIFDFETGGVEPRHPSIQLAAIAVDDSTWAEVAAFEAKIKFNEADADSEALKINHYTPEAWKDALPAGVVAMRFAKFCEPYRSIQMVSKRTGNPYSVGKLAGHNAATFDLPRLRQLFGENFFPFSYHVKDTLQRALWFYDEHPEIKRPESLKLSVLCESFGICIDGAHDALVDVRMSAAIAKAFMEADRK
jgi:DNA polymerase III epsilon subunit-like protein